jgi:hypothetical protein
MGARQRPRLTTSFDANRLLIGGKVWKILNITAIYADTPKAPDEELRIACP